MALLTNIAITNYRNKGLVNLPTLYSNMVSYCPIGYGSLSMNLLLHHSPQEWINTLTCILYKRNIIRWLRVTGFGRAQLVIDKYMLEGTLPECLFPLDEQRVHHIAAYWSEGSNPPDNVRP